LGFERLASTTAYPEDRLDAPVSPRPAIAERHEGVGT
jgi:hypothetical protein